MALDQISIGKFAMMTRLSQKALRLYDRREILIPDAKDSITGYRYYSINQIERGMRIKMLGWLGFGLEDIATIMTSMDKGDDDEISQLLQNRLTGTQLEIARLREVENILLNQEKTMEMLKMRTTTPILKESPQLRVLSSRKVGTYSETIGELIGDLMSTINHRDNLKNYVKINGPVMFIDHNEGYTPLNADIEVAIPISGRISIESETIEIKNLPATRIISAVYTGPYDDIGVAYRKILEFMTEKEYISNGFCRELYLNSPGDVLPEDLITELQFPVAVRE